MTNKILPKKFLNYLKDKTATILALGPMSLNSVDATIEVANEKNVPLMLIASRRQIDSSLFGGGYVNNWNTKNFSKYIRSRDKKKLISLCRDHGGPWQNNYEIKKKYNEKEAMESAKKSYIEDIDSGFEIIHIDTSLNLKGSEKNKKRALNRLFELYKFCSDYAKFKKKDIYFEIGTEEQSGTTNSQKDLEFTLNKTFDFCDKNLIKKPSFVVIQSGTRVLETRNVGTFETPFRVKNQIPAEIQVPKMIEICNKFNILMKSHNTDYLSDDALSMHPRMGIHAANVAPELGVVESREIIKIMNELKQYKLKNEFLKLALDSNKWKKWMIKNSKATQEEKAIIAGHYIFADKSFLKIKKKLSIILKKEKNKNLDFLLKKQIKKTILRYLNNFNLLD